MTTQTPDQNPVPPLPPVAPVRPAPLTIGPIAGSASRPPLGTPVVPSTDRSSSVRDVSASTTSSSSKKIAAAFLAGAVVTGAGFGIGRFTSDPAAVATTDTVIDAVAPPLIEGSPAISVAPATSTNPAAIVAQALGPSVVQIETNQGLGSGVVYADGLILTNHHVIEGASQIQVRSDDGRAFDADLIGSDARNDIAVLSVGDDTDLPVAQLGDGELQVGQTAIAIGSPFQLQQTVTSGIVSALDRPVPNTSGGFTAMIQTDTAINPGNSGGALADRDGRVIGINTSIRTDGTSNGNVGIGFAVPISTALDVATRIVAGETLEPGVLGVSGAVEDGEVGVPVGEVVSGGGADDAGIDVGDRILTVNGAPVSSFAELAGLVQSSFSGDEVELLVQRADETDPVTLIATLA